MRGAFLVALVAEYYPTAIYLPTYGNVCNLFKMAEIGKLSRKTNEIMCMELLDLFDTYILDETFGDNPQSPRSIQLNELTHCFHIGYWLYFISLCFKMF